MRTSPTSPPFARPLAALTLILAGLSTGCGDTSPTAPTPGVDLAVIALSVDPNPISATPSASPGFTFSIQFTVIIQETSGVGGQMQLVRSTLFDPVTGQTVALNTYDDKDLIVFSGANRIAPKGTLKVSQLLNYTVPSNNLSKAANLTVFIQFKDDHGNVLTQSQLVRVI
jgi:hypothetical protein